MTDCKNAPKLLTPQARAQIFVMAKQKNYLFIHQNFPGQFVHVASELVRQGHIVVALGIKGRAVPGVRYLRYTVPPLQRTSEVPQLRDFEVATARGLACLKAMRALKDAGFNPDVIVAHPGWGEMMFCKDVWPQARLVMFAEFFYGTEGSDYAFDAEFSSDTIEGRTRVRLKNTIHLHAMAAADAIYTPTEWQKSRLPGEYHGKVSVIFDGIDTQRVQPNSAREAPPVCRAAVQYARPSLSGARPNVCWYKALTKSSLFNAPVVC